VTAASIEEKVYQRQLRKQEVSLDAEADDEELDRMNFKTADLLELLHVPDVNPCDTIKLLWEAAASGPGAEPSSVVAASSSHADRIGWCVWHEQRPIDAEGWTSPLLPCEKLEDGLPGTNTRRCVDPNRTFWVWTKRTFWIKLGLPLGLWRPVAQARNAKGQIRTLRACQ
jgi:hypothetical protein